MKSIRPLPSFNRAERGYTLLELLVACTLFVVLGALAARTERVQLGTLVTGVTYRNPAILAKMVTSRYPASRISRIIPHLLLGSTEHAARTADDDAGYAHLCLVHRASGMRRKTLHAVIDGCG